MTPAQIERTVISHTAAVPHTEHTMTTTTTTRHYYAVAELPTDRRGQMAPSDCVAVFAFPTVALRREWVKAGDGTAPMDRYLPTWGERRRSVSRDEALSILRRIYPGSGPASLADLLTP